MNENIFSKLKNKLANRDNIELYDEETLQLISKSEYKSFFSSDELLGYFDDDIEEERLYFKTNTPNIINARILFDKDVNNILNIDKLCDFISKYVDKNSLMCMKNICFIYDFNYIEGYYSSVRNDLYKKYSDEYAYEICEEDMLGITWVERQTVIVNVSELTKISIDIAGEPYEYRTAECIFKEGLLQTIFHEFRHLLYECNDFINFTEGSDYPINGGDEEAVENYGNNLAKKYNNKVDFINYNCLKNYIFKEKEKINNSYEEYER